MSDVWRCRLCNRRVFLARRSLFQRALRSQAHRTGIWWCPERRVYGPGEGGPR